MTLSHRRPDALLVVAVLAVGLSIAAVVWVASVLGLFTAPTSVVVVNDTRGSVDLTCLWDNREDLRPGSRTTMSVDRGSTEDCEVDPHPGTGDTDRDTTCLVLDARGEQAESHEQRVSSARDEDTVDCAV
ncbi:hypothetical protein [Curtobacterium sp. VKM Ac-2922]|uniref:hypothetical protein n=1 Tax=Curtobacterium sp. VKM Ac-2922 TaxID=2929475 RepID=UPI001FB279A5|nr:hypothetical protein [Curtobacterium sp. VKM Ac-2922]MCJ1713589.1 hypothetical protein [Curtobacterium sp. VKM Ac-2922]